MTGVVYVLASSTGEYICEPHAGSRWTRDRSRAVRFSTRAEALVYAQHQRILVHPTKGVFPMWVYYTQEYEI